MKIYSVVILLIISSCAYRNENREKLFVKGENYNYKYDLPNSKKQKIIVAVIDSLNVNEFKIPKLIDDLYLDYKFNDMYVTYDKAISTRKFIISRITNIQSLKAILISKNKKFTEKPNIDFIRSQYKNFVYEMPYIELSLNELVQQRLEELGN